MKEQEQRIPFMYVPEILSKKISNKLRGLGKKLMKYFPNIESDLIMTGIKIDPDYYLAKVIVNAFFLSSFFSAFIAFLIWSQGEPTKEIVSKSLLVFLGITLLFMLLHLKYPDLLAQKKASNIDKDLVFALKDITLNISAGLSIYDSFVNVARGDYGETSNEFENIVRMINSGTPMAKALEITALRTRSEYLKKTCWQMINAIKSGSNIKKTLKSITKELSLEQRTRIVNYSRELNLWSLIYMLFAVAVPSIGSTMLVILSSFAGFGITRVMFITFIIMCLVIQYVLIGFIKARRPVSSL
jgi:archaeal flagellar protein FlaJ